MSLISLLDHHYYPGVESHWDDRAFRAFVLKRLLKTHKLLDLGAGAGILPDMNFRGYAAKVCGVDPDPRVQTNPFLDEGRIGVGESIPYNDKTFDIVIADNVLEHLTHPETVFAEIRRVLKPGGCFMFKTPNWRHYMPILAWATPHWLHNWFNELRGRKSVDTFPTVYNANTYERVTEIGRAVGLATGEFCFLESRPEYLRISPITYPVGILYERLVNSSGALCRFRIVLIGELVRE